MSGNRIRRWWTALLLCASAVSAQDYLIRPVPPSLITDSSTSFLLTFSEAKSQADFSLGDPAISLGSGAFVRGGGYKGTVSFASARNLPTSNWTIELVFRLPSVPAVGTDVPLVSWSGNGYSLRLLLSTAVGVHYIFSAPGFSCRPQAGGDGKTIHSVATDKWVYAGLGVDFATGHGKVIAREMDGAILNQDLVFAGKETLEINSSATFTPEAAQAKWTQMASLFPGGIPSVLTVGDAGLEIKALRISNRFRSELFEIQPDLPAFDGATWPAGSIDSARVQTTNVSRTVGYPGYLNYRSQIVTEPFIPLKANSPAVSITLTDLTVGVYSAYVYGYVNRTNLDRVWRPAPMRFSALTNGMQSETGLLLLKQGLKPRLLQGFHFHKWSLDPVQLLFELSPRAYEEVLVTKIEFKDQLAGLPDVAIKKSQNIFANGATSQLGILTDARRQRDDLIWNALPLLNVHMQVHDQYAAFRSPPAGVVLTNWTIASLNGKPYYAWYQSVFEPLDFLNPGTGEIFPAERVFRHEPWPGNYADDGTGIFFDKAAYPSLATSLYNDQRAMWLGRRYLQFLGAFADDPRTSSGLKLAKNYATNGAAEKGHDGAMALVRWTYDWPALERFCHEMRLSTMNPDLEYNSDYTMLPGKMYGSGWSGDTVVWIFEAYDQLFPYIKDNQVFADAVNRFIPWIRTPDDVVRFLDRYLVLKSVSDTRRGYIDPGRSIEDYAGVLLGPSPYTMDLFDLTHQFNAEYPIQGTYQEMYGTALSRSGSYYIASFLTYAFGGAQNIVKKAYMQKKARDAGVTLKMDLADVQKYPKVRGAGNFLLDMWVAGGFPFMIGDASGGTHSCMEASARLTTAREALSQAFELYGDPRHAWLLQNLLSNTAPAVVTAAASVRDPVLFAQSRVVPDYGAILEMTPNETNRLKKTSATLRLGVGQGHSHHDYLDLNLFGMGLPLAVDLACRNEGGNWSRPGANWSFLHNHALAHPTEDPNGAGAQTGEPWLRAFAPPLLRASYVDQTGTNQLERDLVLMEVGDTGTFYGFDVQRLRGGAYHTWSFHGCESESLALNVPTTQQTVRWIDRTLEGTHRVGSSSNTLQATWTMTRRTNSYAYTFNGGGVIDTVACEPAVLGAAYNPALPEVKVRATLLGRGADTVLQGNSYSDVYAYSFPFLWVQSTNEATSVYPAVYEWYRGTTPVVAKAEVMQNSPLQVKVTTTSGQADSYEFTPNYCLAVSRDSNGVRWVKLSGSHEVGLPDVTLTAGIDYNVSITNIDYASRTLSTSAPLPDNPAVVAGNGGRRIFLQLRGSGTSFTWNDDLLVQEGQITSLKITGPDSIALTANQSVLFAGYGNRKAEAMTVITEDGRWHFRGGRVIKKPAGVPLTADVFTDANGDGFVNMKTYEMGVGDPVQLPAEVTLQRGDGVYKIQANVPIQGTVGGISFSLAASAQWQTVSVGHPKPPSDVRVRPEPVP